jgi:hypothetical protein
MHDNVQMRGLEWNKQLYDSVFCQPERCQLSQYFRNLGAATQPCNNETCYLCPHTFTSAAGNAAGAPLNNCGFQGISRLLCYPSEYKQGLHGRKLHRKTPVVDSGASVYVCCTQEPSKVRSDGLSMNTDSMNNSIVRRWTPGSVLTYFLSIAYLPNALLVRIKADMETAVDNWQGTGINITFEESQTREDASFLVVYDLNLEADTYAVAFFPGDKRRILRIGPRMFRPEYMGYMSHVLGHELGHVLGLRHVFWKESGEDSNVRYFPTDEVDKHSIMNSDKVYDLSLFVLSSLDRDNIRDFYNLPAGSQKGFIIEDYFPEPMAVTPAEERKYWVRSSIRRRSQ